MTDQKPTLNVSQLPPNDVQLLLTMVQLLMEEKAQAAEERKARLVVQQARDESSKKLAGYNEKEERNKQRLCTHQKNQPSKHHYTPRALKVDYAVSYHVYPDATAAIRCLICGAVWHKGDTAEQWTKNGVLRKNWTGKGWTEALRMVQESSNTPTRSELAVPQATVLGPGVAVESEDLE